MTRHHRGPGLVAAPAIGPAVRAIGARTRDDGSLTSSASRASSRPGSSFGWSAWPRSRSTTTRASTAWFTWLLVTGHGYHYNPVFHGPVQFYVMSVLYLLIGVGDLAARLAPTLVGTAVIALPYLLRRQIGQAGAIAAAVVLCISPSYLYFSRFVREDIYVACWTFTLIVAVFRFLARPRIWHPAVILGLLAISFATKETTYITVFIFGLFFIGLAVWELRTGRGAREGSLVRAVREVGLSTGGSGEWPSSESSSRSSLQHS